ncbi:hypothetical protein U1Q18_026975 [Sarracenia purpurea var. burkii]
MLLFDAKNFISSFKKDEQTQIKLLDGAKRIPEQKKEKELNLNVKVGFGITTAVVVQEGFLVLWFEAAARDFEAFTAFAASGQNLKEGRQRIFINKMPGIIEQNSVRAGEMAGMLASAGGSA